MHGRSMSTKGAAVANHNHNGGRDGGGRDSGLPDDHRVSWRPQDQSPQATSHRNRGYDDDDRAWRDRGYRDEDRRAGDRDPRRWEGGRGSEVGYYEDRDVGWRSTERQGQGQSGYSAGRHGDDRTQRPQRNDMAPPAGFDDRHQELGVDDRFTGRGRSSYWLDRVGNDPEPYSTRSAHDSARGQGGRDAEGDRSAARVGTRGSYDERMGYQAPAGPGQSTQHVGYQSGSYDQVYGTGSHGPRPQTPQDEAHRSPGTGASAHRGVGPHRGRGPLGYQRSDERIREAVCEALTDDDQLDATHIEIAVRNAEVTLSGMVDNRRAKRNAEDCAYSVSGVRDVQNLLRVRDDDRAARSPDFHQSHHHQGHHGQGSVGNGDIETLHNNGRKPRA
jgi:hypothetical protein